MTTKTDVGEIITWSQDEIYEKNEGTKFKAKGQRPEVQGSNGKRGGLKRR
jgi:hypothetical protein